MDFMHSTSCIYVYEHIILYISQHSSIPHVLTYGGARIESFNCERPQELSLGSYVGEQLPTPPPRLSSAALGADTESESFRFERVQKERPSRELLTSVLRASNCFLLLTLSLSLSPSDELKLRAHDRFAHFFCTGCFQEVQGFVGLPQPFEPGPDECT